MHIFFYIYSEEKRLVDPMRKIVTTLLTRLFGTPMKYNPEFEHFQLFICYSNTEIISCLNGKKKIN